MINGKKKKHKPHIIFKFQWTLSIFFISVMMAISFDLMSNLSNGWHGPYFIQSWFTLKFNAQCFTYSSTFQAIDVVSHVSKYILPAIIINIIALCKICLGEIYVTKHGG